MNSDTVGAPAIAETNQPAVLCVDLDPGTRDQVARGGRRIVVAVKSYAPSEASSGGFRVSLLDGAGNPHVLARFGMFPGGPFQADDASDYRRFDVPLFGAEEMLTGLDRICFEVAVESLSESPAPAEVKAEVAIEISQPVN